MTLDFGLKTTHRRFTLAAFGSFLVAAGGVERGWSPIRSD
jgi:hypothetical protein